MDSELNIKSLNLYTKRYQGMPRSTCILTATILLSKDGRKKPIESPEFQLVGVAQLYSTDQYDKVKGHREATKIVAGQLDKKHRKILWIHFFSRREKTLPLSKFIAGQT